MRLNRTVSDATKKRPVNEVLSESALNTSFRRRQSLRRSWRLAVRGAAVVLLAVFAVVALSSGGWHGVRSAPWAVIVAARRIVLLALTGLGVGWLVWAVLRSRAAEVLAATCAVALLAGGCVVSAAASHPLSFKQIAGARTGQLRLLSWNTNQDRTSATAIAQIVRSVRPDIIVLPEYFGAIATQISAVLPSEEYSRALSWDGAASSVWVSKALGTYRVNTSGVPAWAGLQLQPAKPAKGRPTFVVAHLQHAGLMSTALWNEHLDWVTRACSNSDVVAVGDFNSTEQNIPAKGLGSCRDVAVALGKTSTATWPTSLPAGFGAQIDRVMAGSAWRPVRFDVIGDEDGAGSDHRPIVVDLAPVG